MPARKSATEDAGRRITRSMAKTEGEHQKCDKESKGPNNGVNHVGRKESGKDRAAPADPGSYDADRQRMTNSNPTHLSSRSPDCTVLIKPSTQAPVLKCSPSDNSSTDPTSTSGSSGAVREDSPRRERNQYYRKDAQKRTQQGEQKPNRQRFPLLPANIPEFVTTLQPWLQLLGFFLVVVAVMLLASWSSIQLWLALRGGHDLKTLHQAVYPSNDVMQERTAIPANWQGREDANEKIRALLKDVERLQRDRDRLVVELDNEVLEAKVKEMQHAAQRETPCQEITDDLLLAQRNLDTCQKETQSNKAKSVLCETKESDEAKRASEQKAQLGLCKEQALSLEAEVGTFDNLELKNREQEAELETLNEKSVALKNDLRSCRGELEQSGAAIEKCQNKSGFNGKLKELKETGNNLMVQHRELRKEVYWCKEDRSVYHVRMKNAEEELAKIRKQPLNEKTVE